MTKDRNTEDTERTETADDCCISQSRGERGECVKGNRRSVSAEGGRARDRYRECARLLSQKRAYGAIPRIVFVGVFGAFGVFGVPVLDVDSFAPLREAP